MSVVKLKDAANLVDTERKKKKHKHDKERCSASEFKAKHKRNESKHANSSKDTSSSSSKEERRHLKKLKKEKKAKKLLKKIKYQVDCLTKCKDVHEEANVEIPLEFMSQAKAPMTKEQWEKEQSVVRKVYDESSGRYRLIKGDGEVIEEIVSKNRHKAINEQATKGDGTYFQAKLHNTLK